MGNKTKSNILTTKTKRVMKNLRKSTSLCLNCQEASIFESGDTTSAICQSASKSGNKRKHIGLHMSSIKHEGVIPAVEDCDAFINKKLFETWINEKGLEKACNKLNSLNIRFAEWTAEQIFMWSLNTTEEVREKNQVNNEVIKNVENNNETVIKEEVKIPTPITDELMNETNEKT